MSRFAERFGVISAIRSFLGWGASYIAQLVAGSFVIWLFHAMSAFLFLEALAQPVPYDLAFTAFALSGLAVALPISIDGLGIRETSLAAMFAIVGLSGEVAIAWGVLISSGSLLSRIVGIPLLIKYPLPWFSMRIDHPPDHEASSAIDH